MEPHRSREPERTIRERIRAKGRITFAEFMELALYGPDGYYTRPGRIDPAGDYFTAPKAHPSFGALIAAQLWDMWRLLGRPSRFDAVEIGAGDGTLEVDIKEAAPALDPAFARALSYTGIDRTFAEEPGGAPSAVTGCVLSNELLDAFPVHRFVVQGGAPRELYVTVKAEALTYEPGPVSDPRLEARVSPLAPTLPDGYVGEVNMELEKWANSVSRLLSRGFVLTIDYGGEQTELYRPDRMGGSLRGYYRHTLSQNPFQHIGEQDLTSHVDFTALREAMSQAGFQLVGLTSQGEFLERLGLPELVRKLADSGLPQREVEANGHGMLALSDPEGMGRFKAAVHSRGLNASEAKLAPAGLREDGLPPHKRSAVPLTLLQENGRHFRLAAEGSPKETEQDTASTWAELFGITEEELRDAGETPPGA
ncbi:MAG: class I SAM-dependent methyltransferase [Chloroflexota bacterium]